MSVSCQRRRVIRTAAIGVTCIPLALLARRAAASTNAELRSKLAYQDTPLDGKNCTSCLEFVPGSDPAGPGSCKVIPGDDQILPQGYCTQWNTM